MGADSAPVGGCCWSWAAVAKSPAGDQRGVAAVADRSRNGLTTKIHLACDGRVRHGHGRAEGVPDRCRVARRRPDAVIADKVCSSRAIRQALRRRGIQAVIPERADQKANRLRRGKTGGRPPAFDRELYRTRNVVERCFARPSSSGRSRPASTSSPLHLASLILWLREPVAQPRRGSRRLVECSPVPLRDWGSFEGPGHDRLRLRRNFSAAGRGLADAATADASLPGRRGHR